MYIPESTMFLLEKNKFNVAKKDLEYLLKFNKANDADSINTMTLFERLKEKKESLLKKIHGK